MKPRTTGDGSCLTRTVSNWLFIDRKVKAINKIISRNHICHAAAFSTNMNAEEIRFSALCASPDILKRSSFFCREGLFIHMFQISIIRFLYTSKFHIKAAVNAVFLLLTAFFLYTHFSG